MPHLQPDEGEQNMNSGEALDVLKAILEIKRGPARSPPENQHMLEDSAQVSMVLQTWECEGEVGLALHQSGCDMTSCCTPVPHCWS